MTGLEREIVDLIGLSAAMKLMAAYGGRSLYVPKRITEEHSLFSLFGSVELTQKFVAYFAGETLIIPMGSQRGQKGRRSYAAKLIDEGYTTGEICKKADLHVRSVQRINRKSVKKDLFNLVDFNS